MSAFLLESLLVDLVLVGDIQASTHMPSFGGCSLESLNLFVDADVAFTLAFQGD